MSLPFNEDFRDILQALSKVGADFVVVGAYALAAHGITRATGDIDLFVRPTAENAARVYKALLDFGAPLQAHGVAQADFEHAGTVYQIGLPPRRIDILTQISGVSFEEAEADSISRLIDGMMLRFLGHTTLIRNKQAAARLKDLADVELLKASPKA